MSNLFQIYFVTLEGRSDINTHNMTIQTVTLDIINEKALNLLQDLEQLDLIRMHKDVLEKSNRKSLKGAMTKQSIDDIENQLSELRNEWD